MFKCRQLNDSPAGLVLALLILGAGLVTAVSAQKPASILDRIAQSLPQTEPGWKHEGTEAFSGSRSDGPMQAQIKWSRGGTELGATVFVHRTVASAKRAFLPSGKEDLQEGFRIKGVGDEAFLWPPKTPEGGAYNIRFRKARVEVWMGHASEADLRRYAQAIASSIATSGTGR
jgi:hypothetical protein